MKLLTFLGAGAAYETVYVMPDGREQKAQFCGVALARFFPDADLRVFVTEEANKLHFANFQRLAEDHAATLEPVHIADGADETQLWHIFQAVVDSVEDNEEVVFDITHGFRSLPFLAFLAAAYLRTVKNIRLAAVLYGNFEARDKSVTPNRAPVLDMTRFVELLDWMIAADRFMRFGDAQDLAARLRSTAPAYSRQQTREEADMARTLKMAANAMDAVSMALRLIRPEEAMGASAQLGLRLREALSSTEVYAQPFLPLSNRVADAFAPIAMDESTRTKNPTEALAREQRMVDWYIERKQYVQALAVAREWIISWTMLQLQMMNFLDRNAREEVEDAIREATYARRKQRGSFDDFIFSNGKSLRQVEKIAQALDLYARLGDTRNDLLHAGKRVGAGKAGTMETKIRKLCSELAALPLLQSDSLTPYSQDAP